MPKNIFALLLLFCLLAGGCVPEERPAADSGKSPAAEFPVIEIRTETIRYRTDHISVNLNYPVITGLSDPDRAAELNQAIAAAAVGFREGLESEAAAWARKAAAGGVEFRPYAADITYDVPYNQDGLLSIRINYGSYTGGAHGSTVRETLNLDTVTGEKLHLRDFFAAGSDYLTLVRKEIERQITAAPDDYFPDAAASPEVPEDRFYLTDGAVVVYYDEYALAPYAAGMPEFTIPAQRRL